jgi:hypothetical protein
MIKLEVKETLESQLNTVKSSYLLPSLKLKSK